MDISIIIVNYQSWEPLRECLESILCSETNLLHETIIIDNFSNDDQLDSFKQKFSNFIFISNNSNTGFSSACNQGAKIATGNHFLFLNPDTIILPNTLDVFYEIYKNNPEIGILSCLQINKKNNLFSQRKIFPSHIHGFGISRFFYKIFFKRKIKNKFATKNDLFYPDWVTGAVLFISNYWFEKTHGWNEDYWLYFEDVDICKRITQNNIKVAVTNKTTVQHRHGGSSRNNFATECSSKTEVIISKHVYIQTHFSKLAKIPSHLMLVFFILLEKSILSILSLILLTNLKLKTNRFILKNLFVYYFNAIKNKTWLSPRSTNYSIINL